MDKYYLDFLTELYFFLEKDEEASWDRIIEKSINQFNANRDLKYFFSIFGGMGSFNDYFYFDNTIRPIFDVLKSITYLVAKTIESNLDSDINDILLKEQERYNVNKKLGYTSAYDLKKLKYLNYLINHYELSNLHSIDEYYIKQLNMNIEQSSKRKR